MILFTEVYPLQQGCWWSCRGHWVHLLAQILKKKNWTREQAGEKGKIAAWSLQGVGAVIGNPIHEHWLEYFVGPCVFPSPLLVLFKTNPMSSHHFFSQCLLEQEPPSQGAFLLFPWLPVFLEPSFTIVSTSSLAYQEPPAWESCLMSPPSPPVSSE